MVKLAYIYYEGDSKLQPGLRRFFDSVYREDVRIRLVSGRGDSVSDFIKGMKSNSGATNILLKDSEGPGIQVALDGVRSHDHWDSRLDPQIPDDQLHFMVQVMESWFWPTDRHWTPIMVRILRRTDCRVIQMWSRSPRTMS